MRVLSRHLGGREKPPSHLSLDVLGLLGASQ